MFTIIITTTTTIINYAYYNSDYYYVRAKIPNCPIVLPKCLLFPKTLIGQRRSVSVPWTTPKIFIVPLSQPRILLTTWSGSGLVRPLVRLDVLPHHGFSANGF